MQKPYDLMAKGLLEGALRGPCEVRVEEHVVADARAIDTLVVPDPARLGELSVRGLLGRMASHASAIEATVGLADGRTEGLHERCHGFAAAGSHPQLVVCGMETHVCVLQTVIELLELGKKVFLVEEAVGSRRDTDKALALARMREAGASIVSREMVAFEWLRRADSDLFREISRNFLR